MEIVRTESPRGGPRRFAFCRDTRPLLFLPVAKLDYYIIRTKEIVRGNYIWNIKRSSLDTAISDIGQYRQMTSTWIDEIYKNYALSLPIPTDTKTYIITTP
jgi:hypothetical protein